jgi:hypothetical protein
MIRLSAWETTDFTEKYGIGKAFPHLFKIGRPKKGTFGVFLIFESEFSPKKFPHFHPPFSFHFFTLGSRPFHCPAFHCPAFHCPWRIDRDENQGGFRQNQIRPG